LTAAHYSTRSGRCSRQVYAKGNLVLALFRKTDEGFRPIHAPFARAVEDVESFDSLWVRTARRYIAMQATAPGAALRDMAIAERDRLRAQTSDMEAQAVAADLDAWLQPAEGLGPRPGAWAYDDKPDRTSIRPPGMAGTSLALTCQDEGKAIELEADRNAKPASRALMIGARTFAARENGSRIAFTPELDRLLKQSAGPFVVAVDGKPSYRGEASDVLQKFALRCETRLRP
jgi:hypothetical protein